MSSGPVAKFYSPAEERINVYSHAFGLVLSVVGLVLLILRSAQYGDLLHTASVVVFGLSLVVLYGASTVYHSSKTSETRSRLRVFDHASIDILIAGTYTPMALVSLRGPTGWTIFAFIWSIALVGIALKLFYTGRFRIASTVMYVLMGWILLLAIKPLAASLTPAGIYWLIAGGVAYTVGALLYSIQQLGYNHAIFHIFVLAGSIAHFIMIYFYVIPTT